MPSTATPATLTVEEVAKRLAEAGHNIKQTPFIFPSFHNVEALDSAKVLLADGKGADLFIYEEAGDRRNLRAVPKVGMGVTYLGWTDRHPYHIVKVNTARKLTIRAAKAEMDPTWKPDITPGGFAGHCNNNSEQRWNITPGDETAETVEIRLHKDGSWHAKDGRVFRVGEAHRHHDYNF